MFRKTFLTLTATMVSLLVSGNLLQASVIDFEGFTPGTVNGQSGWTVEDSFGNSTTAFDQEVVDDGSGNMVWRLSNAVTTGGFSDQPFSQTAAQVAGETGSALWNDYGTVLRRLIALLSREMPPQRASSVPGSISARLRELRSQISA